MSKILPTPVRPGWVALRIWSIIVLTGPLLFVGCNWLLQLQGNSIPVLQAGQPDHLVVYSSLLIAGAVLSLVPFLITWGLLAAWKRKHLSPQLMGERLVLLAVLFAVVGIVFLMERIGTHHPLKNAALLLVPYFLAGILGIVRVLGWPWRPQQKDLFR